MRRIVLLITVAALVLVSTMLIVPAAGAQKQPMVGAHKLPTRTVLIQNLRFSPANIPIKRGTKVIWINRDSTAHTVTANDGRSFNSGRLAPGKRFSHTFKTVGKKAYHCEIHPFMKGSVTVRR